MTISFNASAAALSAARALIVKTGTIASLEQWHQNTAGPKIPLTKTFSGKYAVSTQAHADALAGTTVTGTVEITAGGASPSAPLRLRNFSVIGAANPGTGPTSQRALITIVNSSGLSNVVIEDFKLDGIMERAYTGIGGTLYCQNILIQRGDITRVGDDGIKIFKNSVFRHNYVHDLRPWNDAVDGPFNNGAHGAQYPHLDCVQILRTGGSIEENWLKNTTTATATSVLIMKPDIGNSPSTYEDITNYLIRGNYIEGGNNVPIHLVTQSGTLTGAGSKVYGVVVEDNIISQAYPSYPGTPFSVGSLYRDCAHFSGNIWAEDKSAIPTPYMAPRP